MEKKRQKKFWKAGKEKKKKEGQKMCEQKQEGEQEWVSEKRERLKNPQQRDFGRLMKCASETL